MKRSDLKRISVFGNVFIVLFAIVGLWTIGLLKFDGAIPKGIEDKDEKTQAIIVLTGGSGRLDAGLDLLAKDPDSRLFVSGVYEGNEVRHLLKLSKQRPPTLGVRIDIGNAIDTHENATETAVWVIKNGIQSLRLVTAAYHMPRSLLEFEDKLPDVKIIAHPVFPGHVKQDRWWAYPGTAMLVIGEYNKFLLAWIRQRTEHLADQWSSWIKLVNWFSDGG